MGTLNIINQWNDVRKRILDVYPRLTENELQYQEGKEDQLLSTLQQKTGKRREDLVAWLNKLAAGMQRQTASGGSSRSEGSSDKSRGKSPGDEFDGFSE